MNKISYKIGNPNEFTESERNTFLDLLLLQGKVQNPTIEKINRCSLLCVCKVNNEIVSIGAIKPKTPSVFDINKANLIRLRDDFKVELGYCFTLQEHTKRGISSLIIRLLLEKIGNTNIMASTELRSDNSMIRILEKIGFKQYGNPWKSKIHRGLLGLFLRYVK